MTRSTLGGLIALAMLATGCGHAGRSFQPETALSERPPARAIAPPAAAYVVPKEAPRFDVAARAPNVPRPFVRKLSNGVDVTVLRRRDFPTATVLFVLDRGTAAAPPGVAKLYARALLGDSAAYEAEEAHAYLRFVGASVGTTASEDGVIMAVSALSPLLVSALSRTAPMFVSPKLSNDDLDRARAMITAEAEDPSADKTADRMLHRNLFGERHPYAWAAALERPSDVAPIKRDAVTSFRDMFLTAERVHVIATGDVDPDVLMRVLERTMAALPRKRASAAPAVDAPELACRSRVTVVDRPGAGQSQIALGWPGVAADDALGPPVVVLAAATGGWLSSRLNLTIRKELGASYGVRMHVDRLREGGLLEVTGAVDTARTGAALSGMISEIARLRTEPLTEAELETARMKAIIGPEAGSSRGLAFRLARAASAGLSAEKALAFYEHVAHVSADAVKTAASTLLVDDRRCIVIVGDAAKIAGDVSALGLGRTEVVRGAR